MISKGNFYYSDIFLAFFSDMKYVKHPFFIKGNRTVSGSEQFLITKKTDP